ncbi:MAG: ParB N-terminal domain-containing protein [Spirochaetaceae bacterium]|jgi:ParB/RepB/Spo0J family partition protein|nr:ParB N-terminal domain-containing protein [Spirochaetaceae bacterium]
MPKLESMGSVRKIDLAQIIETGNVRGDYTDIEGLADTIKNNGQLQPILVKARGVNADGVEEFELVAGHRRVRAFRLLCDRGDDFNRIDAVVVSGDKLTLQLIENLQRSDLSPPERERGIYEMTKDEKVPQKEIAAMLGKNEQYIWRNINAYKIRELACGAGLDTEGISTNTLCEIASAADGDIPLLIERIKDDGGTLAAARRVSRQYRGAPELKTETENEAAPETGRQAEDCGSYDGGTARKNTAQQKPLARLTPNPRETRTLADFDPPHKRVDINDVLVIIKEYIDAVEESQTDPAKTLRMGAAWDIIALLHEKL